MVSPVDISFWCGTCTSRKYHDLELDQIQYSFNRHFHLSAVNYIIYVVCDTYGPLVGNTKFFPRTNVMLSHICATAVYA